MPVSVMKTLPNMTIFAWYVNPIQESCTIASSNATKNNTYVLSNYGYSGDKQGHFGAKDEYPGGRLMSKDPSVT